MEGSRGGATPSLWDWRRVASEAKAAMRARPGERASALSEFATMIGADAGRVAYLVTQADSLERHRRVAGLARADLRCAPEAAEALRRLEAIAPSRASEIAGDVLRGRTAAREVDALEARMRARSAPLAAGVECALVEAVASCLRGEPRYASGVVATNGLTRAGRLLGVDAEVAMANAEPGWDGAIRPRIVHAVFASPQCRASRNAGHRFVEVIQRAYAALAFYDRVHLFAVAAGEADEVAALEAMRPERGPGLAVTLAGTRSGARPRAQSS